MANIDRDLGVRTDAPHGLLAAPEDPLNPVRFASRLNFQDKALTIGEATDLVGAAGGFLLDLSGGETRHG